MLDYSDLPDALWTRIPEHFGFCPDPAAVARMRNVAHRHAKSPGRPFVPDCEAKRAAAARYRDTAHGITGEVMAALDAARRSAA